MRYVAVVLSLVLVCSCGGGGSSGPDPISESEDPNPLAEQDPALQKSLQILESCTLSELEGLLDLAGLLRDALDPAATPPEFQVTDVHLLDASLDWAVDLDQDATNDLTGTIAFRDGDGNPTFPFNPLDLLAGGLDLASLLAAIQDGTVVVMEFTAHRGVETTGTVSFAITDGQPGDVSGTTVIHGTNCVITLEFEALDLDPTLGAYPSGSADATVQSGDDALDGTLTFDGTSVVTVDMALTGEQSFTFEYDLATGQLKVKN